MAKTIYLDHAATTPLAPEVREAMLPWLGGTGDERAGYGNASSLHRVGQTARLAVSRSRQTIADALGCRVEEIVFTSGGTESDNLVTLGVSRAQQGRGKHMIVSAIEHPAVAKPCEYLESRGWSVTYLDVDQEGRVSPDALESAIRPDTVLVSVIHGHNEIGTIQPIEDLARICRARGVPIHTDAVQTVGKIPINLSDLPVDYMSFTAHKIYGPKGVGGLFVRNGAPRPEPLAFGGGQEGALRPGTENVAGIVGLAEALRLSVASVETESDRLRALQTYLLERLNEGFDGTGHRVVLNGPADIEQRVPGNVHLSMVCEDGSVIEGESLVLQLDLKRICVSSGSACHSAVIEPSKTVLALGKTQEEAMSTLRLSLGTSTQREDVDRVAEVLPAIVERLAKSAKPLGV